MRIKVVRPMEKLAEDKPWQMDKDTMQSALIGAGGMGIATGGLVAALNAVGRRLEQKKLERSQKNTIVITLPHDRLAKGAEAQPDTGLAEARKKTIRIPKAKEEPTDARNVALTHHTQRRDLTGQFGETITKAADPQQDVSTGDAAKYMYGTLVGAPLAFAGGYAAITALYNKMKEQRMASEAEKYRKKYIATLLEKGAGVMDSLRDLASSTGDVMSTATNRLVGAGDAAGRLAWQVGRAGASSLGAATDLTTEAARGFADAIGSMHVHGINLPAGALASAGALATLGAGTTAYLTKTIMDSKFGDKSQQLESVPRRKRIVFRTTPVQPVAAEKRPSEDQSGSDALVSPDEAKQAHCHFMGLLAVEMMRQSKSAGWLSDGPVAEALTASGRPADELYKAASDGTDLTDLACLELPAVQDALMQSPHMSGPCMSTLVQFACKTATMIPIPLLEAAEKAETLEQAMGGKAPAPVDPLSGAQVSERYDLSTRNDIPLPELSTPEFTVEAATPEIARFLEQNKGAVKKRLRVPRARRTPTAVPAETKQ